MAASSQKKPVAKKKTVKSGGTSGRTRSAAKKRTASGARKRVTGGTAAKRKRVQASPPPAAYGEPLFFDLWDNFSYKLRLIFYRYGRRIAFFTLLVLTLCDLLTIPSVFAKTPYDGILVGWIAVLFRGLWGYGYLASFVALPLALAIVCRRDERPVRFPAACALSIPALIGMFGHLLLPGEKIIKDEGIIECIRSLWRTGQALTSGGLFSGGIAELFRAFFSQPVALILLLIALFLIWSRLGFRRPRREWEWVDEMEPYDDWQYDERRGEEEYGDRYGEQEYGDRYGDWRYDERRGEQVYDNRRDEREYSDWRDETGAYYDDVPPRAGWFRSLLDNVGSAFRGLFPERARQYDAYGPDEEVTAAYGRNSEAYDIPLDDEPPRREQKKKVTLDKEEIKKPRARKAAETTGKAAEKAGAPGRTGKAAEKPEAPGKTGKASEKPEAPGRTGKAAEKVEAAPEGLPDAGKKSAAPRKKTPDTIHEEVQAESDKVSRAISRKMARRVSGDYQFPPIELLEKNRAQEQREDRVELARNAKRLEDTLRSFDVSAEAEGDAVRGPSITRYEFKLERGVKLSKIMNLADDIALSLGSAGVRIAPIQNRKSVVGIEVPNSQKTPVLLRDVVETRKFLSEQSATTFALGRDISGEVVTGCIEELPHILIAGTTGSGKSVCTNSMIISLLYKSSPEQLRFIMIDPKMVELAPYNGIPHLLIPVVTDPRKAAGALQWAVGEMMRRYKLFSENGVKKLSEYQRLTQKNKELSPLASVVVVIDELADLMMVAAKEVEESIMRVAQMGRAAGMHLVIATQRPSADVITGLMKANIPSRIAFAVASAMESRIILDSAGAEKLVGNGDMLYAPLGGEKKRVQGCYVSPEEIEKVVSFVKGERETRYDDDVLAKIDASIRVGAPKEAATVPEPVEEQDELLPAAVEIVLETGQASVSMLQRRLKLGYSRAARLVDQMETRGYVGPFEGSRPRQLLITREKWQELRMGAPPSD